MNIIVCIKQVPDTQDIRINPETNTLMREGVQSIVNPFDMYAIEEALRIKEKLGAATTKITVLTMGPQQAEEALREAVSMGVDEMVLMCDRAFAGSDTWATSYTLAKGIQKLGKFDLIICGKQAIDGDTAQVGPGIAATLDIPQVTYVKKTEEIKEGSARFERMTEEGYEVIETPLPCLITVVKEINIPRLPSLKGKIKAKQSKATVICANDIDADPERLGLKGSPTVVNKIFSPPKRTGGQILQGEVPEMAGKLADSIKDVVISVSKT
ncbi:MAG TPA: electron transfer flavoprotein subunit beta/FixA family protein [Candidatus Omnitrophota bacterium]|nr:electron transfer flavoprotein subunit beta/FixA family protein [Candidatus Omnitrophota bacterium]HOX09993.1 electron transfer flavoprotein subunit beta/FixA family protein [Candidatus Omnitrophota bacterium]HRZ67324.1 electron transfer flavoprotein subunit beta/FixA family protein [Candidatus Omnitrophota bacterium]